MISYVISLTGTLTIPVSETLKDPPEYLKIRDVKQLYVNHLMDMLSKETDDHEDLIAQMLVVSSATTSQFKQKELHLPGLVLHPVD